MSEGIEIETLVEKIRRLLADEFAPERLDIIDEGDLHAGHPEALGGGHFKLVIKAQCLSDLPRLQAHRAIYAVLHPLMETQIHALSIEVRH